MGDNIGDRSRSRPVSRNAVSMNMMFLFSLSLLTQCTEARLEQLLLARESEVRALAIETKRLFDNRCGRPCGCSYESCGSTLPNAQCSRVDTNLCGSGGKMELDLNTSTVRLALGTDTRQEKVRESVCFSGALDEGPFRNFAATTIAREPGALQQMMFGSFTGSYRIFPGRGEAICEDYDPRIRPWYVAASSGPKDVLLVLDVSGSMGSSNRMSIMKSAVKGVLDTLTLTEYFNIITFSEDARQLLGSEDELVWASSENVRSAKAQVDALTPQTSTDFHKAFTKAFRILNKDPQEHTSNCQKVVLFLTDGAHTGEGSTIDEVYQLVQRENAKGPRKTPIFSYSLGAGAVEGPPKRLSCESGGVHTAIADGGRNLRQAMTHYYDFAAIGNYEAYKDPSSSLAKPVWVEPYEFASPPGVMGTTVALPIYDDATRTLIGVAAIDVTVDSLVKAAGSSSKLLESLQTRSGKCHLPDLTDCQLEALRKKNGGGRDGNMCGTCTAQGGTTLSPLEPSQCAQPVVLNTLMCNSNGPSKGCCKSDSVDEPEGGGGGMGAGAIVGIVVGTLVLLCVLAGVAFSVVRSKRKDHDHEGYGGDHPPPIAPGGPAPSPASTPEFTGDFPAPSAPSHPGYSPPAFLNSAPPPYDDTLLY